MIKIIPESVNEVTGEKKPVGQLGIRPSVPEFIHRTPIEAVYQAIKVTVDLSVDTLVGVSQMIMRTRSPDELGGILSIGDMAGQSAKSGFIGLLSFMALLSINLGLINLFPIPMLDGGHLLFYGIEAIRGKPVSEKAQEYAFRIGFLVVIGLMLTSTWNDLSRYKVFSWIKNLF
jgi:regulator of sigma E protease